ncbi:MAG: phage portal protein [Hyphomicrobiaceae bacterium]
MTDLVPRPSVLARGRPIAGARLSAPGLRTAYAGADTSRASNIAFWRPPLRSVDAEVLRDAPTIRARARDLVRNNPYAAHAVRISRIACVGAHLRLALRPDWRFLGLDHVDAVAWARETERAWDQYAHGPSFWLDAGRGLSFTDMMNLIHDEDFVSGETLVAVEWDETRPWSTCFQVIDIDRLSNPDGAPETDALKGGVEMDRLGAPIAYHVRNAHPADRTVSVRNPSATFTWTRVPRETAWRRPVMMHSLQRVRAGQTRGVSEFAASIVALRMGHEYQEMELATATAQASIAAVLTTAANLGEALSMVGDGETVDPETGEIITSAARALEESIEYYNELDMRFNGAKIPKLAPGDKLDIVGSKHPTSGYTEFVRNQINAVAAGLGVDPIALSQDYSKANYASNKMSFAHNGRAAETRRARLVRMVGMPMFAAWLEEAIAKGAVAMPKGLRPDQFYAARDALCRGTFITASRALLDPQKERAAQFQGRVIGVETLEQICGEEGESWEDNLEQIARENAVATELGINLPGMLPMLPPDVADTADPKDDETDRKEDR